MSRARVALQQRRFDHAEIQIKLALQRDSLDPESHFILASLLARKGEVDLAVEGYRRVVTLDPNHGPALYNLGTLLLQRREAGPAAEVLERAVEVRPEHAPSFNNLGKAYYLLGVPMLAGSAFEEALERDPDSDVALHNLALLARSAGDEQRAEAYRRRLPARGKPEAEQ